MYCSNISSFCEIVMLAIKAGGMCVLDYEIIEYYYKGN